MRPRMHGFLTAPRFSRSLHLLANRIAFVGRDSMPRTLCYVPTELCPFVLSSGTKFGCEAGRKCGPRVLCTIRKRASFVTK
jgi:hypothetical protein